MLRNAAIVYRLIWKGETMTHITKQTIRCGAHGIITEPNVPLASVLMKVTQTSWQCTQIRGSKRMVWLMAPNKDRPQRRGDCSCSAHKSQGLWEWRRWEEDKSKWRMLWGCREKNLDHLCLWCGRISPRTYLYFPHCQSIVKSIKSALIC